MEYLYGSLEGRCSEAVCHPVRVLEIRIGHVSSFGYLREGAVGSLSLWEMSAEVLFCCFASHSPTLGGVLEKESQSPAIARLPKEGKTCVCLFEGVWKGFGGISRQRIPGNSSENSSPVFLEIALLFSLELREILIK